MDRQKHFKYLSIYLLFYEELRPFCIFCIWACPNQDTPQKKQKHVGLKLQNRRNIANWSRFSSILGHNNFETSGDIQTFQRRRETEIKHGRVAMYATIGDWDQRVSKASWKVAMNCLDSAYVEMILWVSYTSGLQLDVVRLYIFVLGKRGKRLAKTGESENEPWSVFGCFEQFGQPAVLLNLFRNYCTRFVKPFLIAKIL